jgi:hypothetical protein
MKCTLREKERGTFLLLLLLLLLGYVCESVCGFFFVMNKDVLQHFWCVIFASNISQGGKRTKR